MRPGQNRRMRGRNRKGPNPLTRSFESNGPDVKIRGTAQHIAEKYSQLARDAQASGDPVAVENYLQHAEHYYRIVMAAQGQLQQPYGGFQRPFDVDDEMDGEDEGNGYGNFGGQQSYAEPQGGARASERGGEDVFPQGAPQPYQPSDRLERGDRPERAERGERAGGEREGRRGGERRERFRRDNGRTAAPQADDGADAGLPAFLTTPVRQPIAVDDAQQAAGEDGEGPAMTEGPAEGEGEARFPLRPRRRRGRPRASEREAGGEGGDIVAEASTPAE